MANTHSHFHTRLAELAGEANATFVSFTASVDHRRCCGICGLPRRDEVHQPALGEENRNPWRHAFVAEMKSQT